MDQSPEGATLISSTVSNAIDIKIDFVGYSDGAFKVLEDKNVKTGLAAS